MLNRKVTFTSTLRKPHRAISGTVKSVRRNIFSNEVEIHVDSRVFKFKEPHAILMSGKAGTEEIVFLYGLNNAEPTDAALFKEARSHNYKGETIHDAMDRLAPSSRKQVRFQLGEKVKRRFRSKDQ
jgi:hypothetical protein